jgi:glutamine synthetase
VLVRVVESRPQAPGGAGAKRLELRSPDGTCNPYLLTVAVLAAGLDGTRRELDPGQDLTGRDTALLSAEERDRLGAPELPRTLEQALDMLEADAIVAAAVGETILQSFLAAKRSEVRSYQSSVSEWEYAHYLDHF